MYQWFWTFNDIIWIQVYKVLWFMEEFNSIRIGGVWANNHFLLFSSYTSDQYDIVSNELLYFLQSTNGILHIQGSSSFKQNNYTKPE